jgi:pantetheine-phosphate adenylyltransferase
MRRGLVSLSADPIHIGHLWLVEHAAEECDELVVWVGNTAGKDYLFDLDERAKTTLRAIRTYLGHLHRPGKPDIKVVAGSGLLTDVLLREGCHDLFRGVRNEADRRFEHAQIALHEAILPGFRARFAAHYLECPGDLRVVSSSFVKSLVDQYVDVSSMVPPFVKARLEYAIHGQVLVGVTGPIGAGKSHVCRGLLDALDHHHRLPAHHIALDEVLQVFYRSDDPGAKDAHEAIVTILGGEVRGPQGLDSDAIKERVVTLSDERRVDLHRIVAPHMGRLLRQMRRARTGVILIEWARLAEDGMVGLTNNNVILVDSPDRDEFLQQRGVSQAFIEWANKEQASGPTKLGVIEEAARQAGYGTLLPFTNVKGAPIGPLGDKVDELFQETGPNFRG